MKMMNLKMAVAAVTLATLAGGAKADLTTGSTVNNGSMSMLAFNIVTRDWYIRDLGYLLNDFVPSGVTTAAADGGVAGDKSPEAGITIDGTVKSNFSDPAFATWFAAQTSTDVRWMVGSYDQISSAGTGSQRRMMLSSKNPNEDFANAVLDSFVSTGNWGGLGTFFNPGTLSKTGTAIFGQADTGANGGLTLENLGTVGDSSTLFYAVRSAFTGSSSNSATITKYGNSAGLATLTLFGTGELVYSLAPAAAVPLPAAAWLLGAGLIGIGGMVRRRRAENLQG